MSVEETSPNTETQFKVGNNAWKSRSSHGRRPKFESPEVLESACEEYFQWVNDNPLMTVELVKFQGVGIQHQVPKMRAMTIGGLCVFLDITKPTWDSCRKKADFLSVTTRVEQIIYNQKFEGAAGDLLNPNIIARELGLRDTSKHVTDDGKGGDAPIGQTIDLSKLSDSALAELKNAYTSTGGD